MKILQVSSGLPPRENAGVELYTFYLSRELTRLGHEVPIFCREEAPEKEEFSVSEEEYQGLRVTRVVNNLTQIRNPKIFYDNPFFDQAFSEILTRERPDLVHFQHFIALSSHLLRIARGIGIPVILTLHDYFILCHRVQLLKQERQLCGGPLYGLECASCLGHSLHPEDFRTRYFLKWKRGLPFSMIRWSKRFFIPPNYLEDQGYEAFHRYRFMYEILKIPEVVLTPSRFLKSYFLKYYPFIGPKTVVLPLGIFPEENPVSSQKSPRAPEGRVRFCYFGNILPSKGIHVLIEAFKALPEKKAMLTIYGSRNIWTETYYDQLKQQAEGFRIEFRPPFKRDNLSGALRDQDVVVLPSIWPETFSLMIREANSLGLPVIGSDIGAIPEAIQEGINGFLFEPGNAQDLKRCMLRFIEHPGRIRSMAFRMPRTRTMAEHVSRIVEIYEKTSRKR